MVDEVRSRVAEVAGELDGAQDLAEVLGVVAYLAYVAGRARDRLAVAAVLDHGWSYREVGGAVGVTRQAAHKQYAGAVNAERRRRLPSGVVSEG